MDVSKGKKQNELMIKIKKLKTANLFGFVSIIMTIIYGTWGSYLAKQQLKLSQKQDSTSLDLRHFEDLLTKTDRLISENANQLKVSDSLLHIEDNANKNRFIAAIFSLGGILGSESDAKKFDGKEHDSATQQFANKLITVFESQMNNPYLSKDDSLYRYWINAYVHLKCIGHQGFFDDFFDGTFDVTERNRIDELTQKRIYRNFFSVWNCANEAYIYSVRKFRKDIPKLVTY